MEILYEINFKISFLYSKIGDFIDNMASMSDFISFLLVNQNFNQIYYYILIQDHLGNFLHNNY